MLLNSANLTSLNTSFEMSFNSGFEGAESMHELVATTISSTTSENVYPFLGEMPGIREWIAERQMHKLEQHKYSLVNKSYELTIQVKRDSVDDDQYGVYMPMFQQLGYEAKTYPSQLVYPLLGLGFSTECYDGQFFFDTDHPGYDENGQEVSVSNMQAGAGVPWYLIDDRRPMKPLIYQLRRPFQFVAMDSPDNEETFKKGVFTYGIDGRMNGGYGLWQTAFGSKAALDATNFEAARTAMGSLKKKSGAPLAIIPTKLICGSSNQSAAEKVLKAQNKANGESNTNYKAVELVVVPWLP